MLWIAPNLADRPVTLDDRDAARVVTVPRTCGQHHLVNLSYHDSLLPAYDLALVLAVSGELKKPTAQPAFGGDVFQEM